MKNLFVLPLVAIAALIPVEAVIPSWIKVCKQNDPDVNNCIVSSIDGIRPQLVKGIPELAVPPVDPLYIEEATLDLGRDFAAQLSGLSLQGLKNTIFRNVVVNFEKDTFDFEISIPDVDITGNYDVNAKLAGIPLKGNGPMRLAAKSVVGRGKLQGKKVPKGDKTLYFFPSMTMKLDMKTYTIKLHNLFPGDPKIGEVTNKLLNEEQDEVKKALLPGLEKAVIEKILAIAGKICQHFTWDELFPEV